MRAAELRSRILWASRAAHCARSIASALVLAIATGSCTPFDRETEGAGDRSVAPVDAGSLPASRSPTLGFDALEIREVLEAAGFKCAGTKIAPVPGWSCSFVELDGTSYAVQADVDPSGTVTTLTATGSAAGSLLDEQPVRDFFRYLVGRLRPGATLPAARAIPAVRIWRERGRDDWHRPLRARGHRGGTNVGAYGRARGHAAVNRSRASTSDPFHDQRRADRCLHP